MTVYQILCLVGVPSILSMITGYLIARVRRISAETNAVKAGVQALLRNELYGMYDKCKKRGCAEQWERDNFENLYQKYHTLGLNGVMDDTRARFLALPVDGLEE